MAGQEFRKKQYLWRDTFSWEGYQLGRMRRSWHELRYFFKNCEKLQSMNPWIKVVLKITVLSKMILKSPKVFWDLNLNGEQQCIKTQFILMVIGPYMYVIMQCGKAIAISLNSALRRDKCPIHPWRQCHSCLTPVIYATMACPNNRKKMERVSLKRTMMTFSWNMIFWKPMSLCSE